MKLKPIISEKTIRQYTEDSKATFEVPTTLNKSEAKKELEQLFKVKIASVNVINRLGKLSEDKRTRKIKRKSQDKKIMIFTLKSGEKIDIFESNK